MLKGDYNILILEDDRMLNEGIAFNLQMEGFNTISTFTIKETKTEIKKNNIDLIILDVNLPDGNGFDFCMELRSEFLNPIMFLTACDMEIDIVKGLRLGGDDYMTKPFSISILRERVMALLRRYGRENKEINLVKIDEFVFDVYNMTVMKNGKNIILAPTEYRLLKKLAISKGRVFTRDELINEIWESGEYIEEHTLTVNINRLRSKIEDNLSKPKYIKTVYGIGYLWAGDTI